MEVRIEMHICLITLGALFTLLASLFSIDMDFQVQLLVMVVENQFLQTKQRKWEYVDNRGVALKRKVLMQERVREKNFKIAAFCTPVWFCWERLKRKY